MKLIKERSNFNEQTRKTSTNKKPPTRTNSAQKSCLIPGLEIAHTAGVVLPFLPLSLPLPLLLPLLLSLCL